MENSVGEETFALHCRLYKLEPEREVRFCPERKWRFDFAFREQMLAVEVEGGTWTRGRHQRAKGYESDTEKYNQAVLLGWRVLRFTTAQVESGNAIDTVLAALK